MFSEVLDAGQIVREPVGAEKGYWVGAPGAFYAEDEKAFYLTYRIRRPRGVAPDRGGEARIARSTDLRNFQDVWSVNKDQFSTASIERCALRKGPDQVWRYFACYVDPADGRWGVWMLKARNPAKFDPANARPLFSARSLGLEGVKDPWIFYQDGLFHLFLSVAVATPRTAAASHATLDIFNTGDCISATALATSRDLDTWDWQGVVSAPGGPGWDAYCRRINSVLPWAGKFWAFYDGSASAVENYEEKTGLAVSTDLRDWRSATPTAPALTSPHASGSLRYLDAQVVESKTWCFYEFARADGAHDLRCCELTKDSANALFSVGGLAD